MTAAGKTVRQALRDIERARALSLRETGGGDVPGWDGAADPSYRMRPHAAPRGRFAPSEGSEEGGDYHSGSQDRPRKKRAVNDGGLAMYQHMKTRVAQKTNSICAAMFKAAPLGATVWLPLRGTRTTRCTIFGNAAQPDRIRDVLAPGIIVRDRVRVQPRVIA
jgi:hypothetical protein